MIDKEIELMDRLAEIANEEFDGHFTVMKFSTNWKVSFGTPMTPYSHEPSEREEEMCTGRTFAEAADLAIKLRRRSHFITWCDTEKWERENEEKYREWLTEEVADE